MFLRRGMFDLTGQALEYDDALLRRRWLPGGYLMAKANDMAPAF